MPSLSCPAGRYAASRHDRGGIARRGDSSRLAQAGLGGITWQGVVVLGYVKFCYGSVCLGVVWQGKGLHPVISIRKWSDVSLACGRDKSGLAWELQGAARAGRFGIGA